MRPEFGNRMKQYEEVFKAKLVSHVPIICRIDGKAFHSYTKTFDRPFDKDLHYAFVAATHSLYKAGIKFSFAYGQSDEVSLLMYNPSTFSQDMFGGEVAKLNSVIASIFTAHFNSLMFTVSHFKEVKGPAYFDCRVYNIPLHEVINYFIWRQDDASRNSISMLGRCYFSHKQLERKSCSDVQDLLMNEKQINWKELNRYRNKRPLRKFIIQIKALEYGVSFNE